MPKRVQMTRQRPWRREHPDAVIVDRTTKWGNPFRCDTDPGRAVETFRTYLTNRSGTFIAELSGGLTLVRVPAWHEARDLRDALPELAGRDLACWCPLSQPCHADVLLELANGGVHRERAAGGAVVKGEVLRELRVRIDGRERVVRVRRRIAPTGPRCPEWWHGWCQHPLGHAGPHKWGDR